MNINNPDNVVGLGLNARVKKEKLIEIEINGRTFRGSLSDVIKYIEDEYDQA